MSSSQCNRCNFEEYAREAKKKGWKAELRETQGDSCSSKGRYIWVCKDGKTWEQTSIYYTGVSEHCVC